MRNPLFKRLDTRLVFSVGIGLAVFALISGVFTYSYSYRHELGSAESLQQQLVRTVQVQAEVAAYAANNEIAKEVLAGLTANPIILAARIESMEGFKSEQGFRQKIGIGTEKIYPLISPVDRIERIGALVVIQNDNEVDSRATRAALLQTLLMLVQVVMAVLILAAVLRVMIINPITGLAQSMTSIQPGSSTRIEIAAKHATDEIGMLSKSANAMLDAAETALDNVKAQRNELERLATHDHLTGLPTLRLADDRLHVACSKARRSNEKVALLFIDLDGFKAVNDTYGHDAGDEVLKEVSRRLRASLREEDTAARIGGDEFLVILGDIGDVDASAMVAENIVTAVSRPVEFAGHPLQLGASIGIAIFPDHTGDVQTLIRAADQAMYRVKKSKKGTFAFAVQETAP